MPEIKNNFLRSKMNKDLDARLIPNGEYRDAVGININQSEGPDVGAMEVVLGNEKLFSLSNPDMRFIGRFDDEVNDVIYLFATDHTGQGEAPSSTTHQILRYANGGTTAQVLVEGYFLNFTQDNIITGVNLLETQLFFTDNRNQPRVIDVTNTLGYYTKEEHISVAKFSPYKSISILFAQDKQVASFNSGTPSDIVLNNVTDIKVGDIVYNETQQAEYGHVEEISGTTVAVDKDLTDPNEQAPGYTLAKPPLTDDVLRFSRSTMTDESDDPNWPGDPDFLEDKFVRFSYRFKYDNNEYSLVAPWTQPVFIPKQFGFFGEKIYDASGNLLEDLKDEENAFRSTILNWFENRVNQVELRVPFPSNDPVNDYKIKQVEILFKESDAVQQQVLERVPTSEVTFDANYEPQNNYYNYTYQSKKPYRTLPESVTTRVSDKAPVKALSQELISNRVVYGNFADRWDPPSLKYTTQANPRSSQFSDDVAEYPNHTLKQNRNYTIGVVFYDKYGRASSVVTSDIVSQQDLDDKISTLYHAYKDQGDVGYGGFTGDYRIYDWLGDQLRINFQQAIPEFPVNNYPGAYAQGTTFTLTTGNTTSITTTAPFTYTITGVDFTSDILVDNYLRGYYVDYTKVISSEYINGDTVVVTEEQPADIYEYNGGYPGLEPLEPKRSYKINPAGWYSFRIVVQQQEQDYYNVYLPGLTNGFPWNGDEIVSPFFGSRVPLNELFPQNVGSIATTPLISDNINKIPRDLAEVGPDQEQYRSSDTKLFLRVNNTKNLFRIDRLFAGATYSDATNVPTQTLTGDGKGLTVNITVDGTGGVDSSVGIYELGYGYKDGDEIRILGGDGNATAEIKIQDKENQLYFPGRSDHYVSQIGKQQEILDATASTDPGNTLLSKYIPYDGYYSSESNPLIAVIELNNQEQAGVTYQEWFSSRPLLPRLCVYETEPVQSVLDIYWETSTNGLVSDLNDLILTSFNGVFDLRGFSSNFRESIDYSTTPQTVTDIFYGIDSTGGNASGLGPQTGVVQVTDGNGVIVQTETTPTGDQIFYLDINPTAGGDELRVFCQKSFTYRDISSVTDRYTVTIRTQLGGEITEHDRIIPLQNDPPFFLVAQNTNIQLRPTEQDVAAITGLRNGAGNENDPFPENKIVQLIFEIAEQRKQLTPTTDIVTDIFTVDPITYSSFSGFGQSFLRVNATQTQTGDVYTVKLRATDASQGIGFLVYEVNLSITILDGPKITSGQGTVDFNQSLVEANPRWECNTSTLGGTNQPLRQYNIYNGFLRPGSTSTAGGCYSGCYYPNTTNFVNNEVSRNFGQNSNPLFASSTSHGVNVSNIDYKLSDLQAEVISSIVNPGVGYSVGSNIPVTGGSGLNMTIDILSVDANGGITSAVVANSGTLPSPQGTGPTGYVNGDQVSPVGGAVSAILELDGGIVSGAFVLAYELITPNIQKPDYQFNTSATGKQPFEILHKWDTVGVCPGNGTNLKLFAADYSPSSNTGDPKKGYLTFSISQGQASINLTHVITNIWEESWVNASFMDTIAGNSVGKCNPYSSPIFGVNNTIMGTTYFKLKLKAYDPTGRVFTTPRQGGGTLTGWTYYDNNLLLAENTVSFVFHDMQPFWGQEGTCELGINDGRSLKTTDCGGALPCP